MLLIILAFHFYLYIVFLFLLLFAAFQIANLCCFVYLILHVSISKLSKYIMYYVMFTRYIVDRVHYRLCKKIHQCYICISVALCI